MVTKKWVEDEIEKINASLDNRKRELIDLQRKAKDTEIELSDARQQLGYGRYPLEGYLHSGENLLRPHISLSQKLDAICKYLGIEIVKEQKEEKIVARKIRRK